MEYNNIDKIVRDLKNIGYVDLTSNKTEIKQAVNFCKKVFAIIMGCKHFDFTDEDITKMSNTLKEIGCVKHNDAASKFISNNHNSLSDVIELPNNIEFPLSLFSQLIDTNSNSFTFAISLATDGDEMSWINSWIDAQDFHMEEFTLSQ